MKLAGENIRAPMLVRVPERGSVARRIWLVLVLVESERPSAEAFYPSAPHEPPQLIPAPAAPQAPARRGVRADSALLPPHSIFACTSNPREGRRQSSDLLTFVPTPHPI
ncbi:hypothetical protein ACG7TL_007375 [Trametes sanguinea]